MNALYAASRCRGQAHALNKPQPGRRIKLWTVRFDPLNLFRAGLAQFGSLEVAAMLKEGTLAQGTLLEDPAGQVWRVFGYTKIKVETPYEPHA